MSAGLMTVDRALQINGRLVEAWMVREGIRPGPVPSFRGMRLADAKEAIATIASADAQLDASSIARLFAWAALQCQMS